VADKSVRKGQFYPVWDWKIADIEAAVKRHGVRLAQDYQLWEHNMAAADAVFWAKLKAVYPDDWALVPVG
jgi:predicted phosphoadenosine phosphosulfate sulfurtransferase